MSRNVSYTARMDDISARELVRYAKLLKDVPRGFKRAIIAAMSKAETVIRSYVPKAMSQKFYVTQANVRKTMRLNRSVGGIYLRMTDTRHNLQHYKLTPQRPPRKPRKKYTLKGAVKRAGGLKTLQGENPFLLPRKKGYKYGQAPGYIVLDRIGAFNIFKGYPTPAYSQLFEGSGIAEEAVKIGYGAMRAEFNRQMMKELGVMT